MSTTVSSSSSKKGNDTIEHAVIIWVSVGTDSPFLSFMLLVRLIDCVIHEVVGFSFEIIGIPIEVIKRLHLVWIRRAVTILIPVVFIYISSVCPVEYIGLVFHTGIFSEEYTIQAFYCLDDIFFKEVLFIAGPDTFADDALPESLCGRVEEVASLGAAELVGVLLPLTCDAPLMPTPLNCWNSCPHSGHLIANTFPINTFFLTVGKDTGVN